MHPGTTPAGRTLVAALATAGAVLLAVTIASGSSAAPDRSSGGCAGADAPAVEATAKQVRRAVRCLIAEERAIRGQDALRREHDLQRVAQRHSRVMAAKDCLAHRCEGEAKLETRIRRGGYIEGATAWEFAENTGCGVSAEAMVESWMSRTYHRVNILDRRFEDVGVGIVPRRVDDRCGRDYATFALLVGYRELEGR